MKLSRRSSWGFGARLHVNSLSSTPTKVVYLVVNLFEELNFAVAEKIPRSHVIVDDDIKVAFGHVFVHVAREIEEKPELGEDFDGVADCVGAIFTLQRFAKQRLRLIGDFV